MDFTDLTAWAGNLRDCGQWRRLLLLLGDPRWASMAATSILQSIGLNDVPWLGESSEGREGALPLSRATGLLGREFDALVLDLCGHIDPDALGASSGTLRAGGLLLLLLDPNGAPARAAPRFTQRLLHALRDSPGTAWAEQSGQRGVNPLPGPGTAVGEPPEDAPCRTRDQAEAVNAITHLVRSHRHRPLVLEADRGRGKSAALGIAAARLLGAGSRSILLTAPRLDAVLPALEHGAALLPEAQRGRGHLRLGGRSLEFVPPDALLLAYRPADLLLVDEAAAIPTALLEGLLQRYPRIVFATTTHGYEGTGRGFAVRFRHTLDRLTPQWRQMRLHQPIRWAEGDPLEQAVFRALLLNASPAPDQEVMATDPPACEYQRLSRERLAADGKLLGQVFGLLVLSHYRTRPRDLLHLLDGDGLCVHVLRVGERVLGTVLAADEGGLDEAIAYQVSLGRRRLHGHLLPQTLAQHLGLVAAATLRLRRVVRIAVHPALQGRGLGTRLLGELARVTQADGLDGCGASFGADERLLGFWRHAGFAPVRLGVSRETSSGSHSANVLLPLSEAGRNLFDQARRRFMKHLPYMLGDALRDLEPGLARSLMAAGPPLPLPRFCLQDRLDLTAFAVGHRRYEVCPAPVRQLAQFTLSQPPQSTPLTREQAELLLVRTLQNRSWKHCAELFGLDGRRAAETLTRKAVARVLESLRDNTWNAMLRRARGDDSPKGT
jgi:tRNA(Met) cytidine acetyltransferase